MATSKLPLDDHPFIGELVKSVRDIFADVGMFDSRNVDQKPRRKYYNHEIYTQDVLDAASEVLMLMKQLLFTGAFLSSYGSTIALTSIGVNRFEYLIYHIENHILRSTALLDRSLILVNEVFRLGLLNNHCKYHIISENAHVKSSNVFKTLKKINVFINPGRKNRNMVAHQARYRPEDFRDIEMLSIAMDLNPGIFSPRYLKNKTDRVVALRKKEILNFNDNSIVLVSEMFTEIHEIYKKNLKLINCAV